MQFTNLHNIHLNSWTSTRIVSHSFIFRDKFNTRRHSNFQFPTEIHSLLSREIPFKCTEMDFKSDERKFYDVLHFKLYVALL